MSASNDSDGRAAGPDERQSVLGNLPRTRPQRSSARRAAARRSSATAAPSATAEPGRRPRAARAGGSAKKAAPSGRRAKPKATSGRTKKPASTRRSARAATTHAVPRQGYESEADRARGPVQPPGGTELIASAVEIVGDLAKSGIATGERVLKDVFSRLSP